MDEAAIKLEARLFALEYTAAHLLSRLHMIALTMGATPADIEKAERRGNELLSAVTVPDVSPAMSDHFSAELQDQITYIWRMAREMRERPMG